MRLRTRNLVLLGIGVVGCALLFSFGIRHRNTSRVPTAVILVPPDDWDAYNMTALTLPPNAGMIGRPQWLFRGKPTIEQALVWSKIPASFGNVEHNEIAYAKLIQYCRNHLHVHDCGEHHATGLRRVRLTMEGNFSEFDRSFVAATARVARIRIRNNFGLDDKAHLSRLNAMGSFDPMIRHIVEHQHFFGAILE